MTGQGETEDLMVRLADAIADVIGRPIRHDENFFEAGLNSRELVELHARMTSGMPRPFPVTLMFARPNLRALGSHLAGDGPVTPAPGRRARAVGAADTRRAAAARRALHARGLDGRPDGD